MGKRLGAQARRAAAAGTALVCLLAVVMVPSADAQEDPGPGAATPSGAGAPVAQGEAGSDDDPAQPEAIEVAPIEEGGVADGADPAAGAEAEEPDACGATANAKSVSGSLLGSDGRYINAFIGLAIKDSNGNALATNGCGMGGGYADTRSLNPGHPLEGAGSGTGLWSFNLPSNAATVWLEVYPKSPPNGAVTNKEWYGGVLRRNLFVGFGSVGNIHLRAPLTCDHGGTTGGIAVKAYRLGRPIGVTRVGAWSGTATPPGGQWGWGIDSPPGNSHEHTIEALIPNQRYTVQVTIANGNKQTHHLIPVYPCSDTPLAVGWGAPKFSDVPYASPFYDEILWMSDEGITTGFAGGATFHPLDVVTRQAMAAFMYRLAGSPAYTAPTTPTFLDVPLAPIEHPFYDEIEWMNEVGITNGYDVDGGKEYRSFGHVSREAMSAFMYRVAGEPAFGDPATPSFSDVPLDHTFFHEIEWMADAGITTGYGNGTYRPGTPVSRQAMSAFMQRLDEGPGVGV